MGRRGRKNDEREGEKTRRRLREEGKVKKYLYSTFKAKVYLFIADILAIKLRLKVLLFLPCIRMREEQENSFSVSCEERPVFWFSFGNLNK